jgi:hypothetical protein
LKAAGKLKIIVIPWKLATTLDDAMHFLKGDVYKTLVSSAEIVTVMEDSQPRYYIFYQSQDISSGQSSGTWISLTANDPDTAMRELSPEGSCSAIRLRSSSAIERLATKAYLYGQVL